MSLRLMSLVWDNFPRGGSDKLTMLALADWCNDQGGSLHPSVSAVAKKINLTDKQARVIMHRLIEEEWLSVVGNHNGGNPGQSRHYVLNVQKLLTPPMEVSPTPPAEVTPHLEVTPPVEVRDPSRGGSFTPPVDGSLTTIETPRTTNKKTVAVFPGDIPEQLQSDFIQLRKAKKAPLTQTALDGIAREAAKAGVSLQDALETCCQRGWTGFKAEWVANGAPKNESTDDFMRRMVLGVGA